MTLSLLPHPVVIDLKIDRLWEAAWLMHKLSQLPDVRADKVAAARAAIQAGAYEPNAVLDAAIDRLADDLRDDTR